VLEKGKVTVLLAGLTGVSLAVNGKMINAMRVKCEQQTAVFAKDSF
jgi:hypothetical protein